MKTATFENLPDDKQERILSEATREFAEHGFHQASINRMVNRLGIAKGSLFKYFGTKEGLFEYLFDAALRDIKTPLREIRDKTSGLDLFDRIRLCLLAAFDFVDAHPRIYAIYVKMQYQENFPMRDRFLKIVRLSALEFIGELVDDAIRRGEIADTIDREITIFMLESVLERALHLRAVDGTDPNFLFRNSTREQREKHVAAIANILRNGLQSTR